MVAHCDPSTLRMAAYRDSSAPMEGPGCDPLSDASIAGLAASYGHYTCLAYALEKGYHLDRSLINFCASEPPHGCYYLQCMQRDGRGQKPICCCWCRKQGMQCAGDGAMHAAPGGARH